MIEVITPPVRRHPSVISGMLPCRVTLGGGVRSVQTGTPLRTALGGWVPASDLFDLVAAEYGAAGSEISAYRGVILDFHRRIFEPGQRLSIADVDDSGLLTLKPDLKGPFFALTQSTVLMDATIGAVLTHASLIKES